MLRGNNQFLNKLKYIYETSEKSVQTPYDLSCNPHQNFIELQQTIAKLTNEVRQLKDLNQTLLMHREKHKIHQFILKDNKQFNHDVKQLLLQYKKKIQELANGKKEIQNKYRNLREKLNSLNQHIGINPILEVYHEKIEILQKLTQKQQYQIEQTISVYELQLKKIQSRRKEEIQNLQNQRIDIESQNLKLCIELQKNLNQNQTLALSLQQQKSNNSRLLKVIELLREENKQLSNKNIAIKQENMVFKKINQQNQSKYEIIKNDNLRLEIQINKLQSFIKPPINLSLHSQVFEERVQDQKLKNIVFVNGVKFQKGELARRARQNDKRALNDYSYQFSDIDDRDQIISKISKKGKLKSPSKSLKSHSKGKITITYGVPNATSFSQIFKGPSKQINYQAGNKTFSNIFQRQSHFNLNDKRF